MPPLDTLLEQVLAISPEVQLRLLVTLIGVAAIVLVRWLVLRSVTARVQDVTQLYRWRKGAEYVTLVLGFWLIVRIWVSSNFSVSTYLGLLSAGLAIALQDPITNLVGWLFLIWRRPFAVGDRVQIGDKSGDVIDMRYFQFTMLEIGNWVHADQSTGRILYVPNRMVFSEIVANYTKGFNYIWNEIPVEITFESDWRAAKSILNEIIEAHATGRHNLVDASMRAAAQRHLVTYDNLTPIVYTQVGQSGVILTMRYLCQPRERRSTTESLWEAVLTAFAARADIQLAYPTRRIYYEGSNRPAADQKPPAAAA